MYKLYESLETKLESALSLCLISDIWTSKQMLDFMGLAASYTDKFYERHVIIIGMMLMPGNHSAEYI